MKLRLGARDIYNGICGTYGYDEVAYGTVARWIRKFESGLELFEDAPKSGRKTSAKTKKEG